MPMTDFDFLFGRWNVRNRKLRDVSDPDCTEWVTFDATAEVAPVLGGVGHVDRMFAPTAPDGPGFEGFTLRLHEPSADIWRIWWSSTRLPGVLDIPVEGRFTGTTGTFETDDTIGGIPTRVRFEWVVGNPSRPVWQQSFCRAGSDEWALNWEMTLTPA